MIMIVARELARVSYTQKTTFAHGRFNSLNRGRAAIVYL